MTPLSDEIRMAQLENLLDGCVLRLFSNDAEPTPQSTLADFEEAPLVGGYAPYMVPLEAWGVDGFTARLTHAWELRGAALTVAGWVLERDGVYVGGKRFPQPLMVSAVGGRVECDASLQL